jgi:hypothetical protein
MRDVWIRVSLPDGYEVDARSMASSAADLLSTGLHAIDHRADAEVLTTPEAAAYFGSREAPDGR